MQGNNANGDPYTFMGDGSGLTNLQISGAEGGTVTSIQAGTGLTVARRVTPNPITGAGTMKIDEHCYHNWWWTGNQWRTDS